MSLEERSDKLQGFLGNRRFVEGVQVRAGDLGELLWSLSREAGGCLGVVVDGIGKGLVVVMLDRVYGKEWNERKV